MYFYIQWRKKIHCPMKEVLPVKKQEEVQPKKVLNMHQFEKESMETKICSNGSRSG